jgi:thioredoxin 1
MEAGELTRLFKEHDVVLLEFHASWCEPCKWAVPVVNEIMGHFKDSIYLQKFDIDSHPDISRDFQVLSVPTFILIRNGAEVWRMRGFDIAPVMIRSLEKFVS